ncbi:MAG: ISAs1 family transposase [Burkholderiales bacterium]|nr:ISAs1 family transposase [Burkholderiales bacterium]
MATQGYRLLDFVVGIHDPRVVGRTDQDLVDILVVSLRAVMAGVEGWDDIEDWGSENEAMLRRYLKLRNGVPGHDTIHRVFELLDPREVQKRFADWVGHVCVALERPVIAIDGKSLRGSGSVKRGVKALQWVSAYATEVGVVLAQQRCAEKSNESTAIEQLLPSLALKGAIVTIDAMGCQTEIAQTIVARGGDYLLSVKDNQPKLHEAIQEYFAIAEAEGFRHLQPEVSETLNKGHGRLETRRCTVLAAPAYLEELARWKDVRALVKMEARREIGDKVETETRYAITSLAPNAQEILRAARLHWGIQNGLFRCLDVAFRGTPLRSGYAMPRPTSDCCDASP